MKHHPLPWIAIAMAMERAGRRHPSPLSLLHPDLAPAAPARLRLRRGGRAVAVGVAGVAVQELAILLPDLAVVVDLLLPDGNGRLELVDDVAACLHGVGAVRGGGGHEHAGLPGGDGAQAVRHGQPPQRVQGPGLPQDGPQAAPRHGRVRLVPELHHAPPREVVPRRALERRDGARRQVPHVVHVPGDVQPPRTFLHDLDQVLVLLGRRHCRRRLLGRRRRREIDARHGKAGIFGLFD